MKSLRDEAVAVQRNGRAALTIVLACLWALPQLIFWYDAWDVRRPLITIGFLCSALVALVAVRLPETYYRVRAFESSGRLYEAIGVHRFRRFMMDGDYMNAGVRRTIPGYRVIAGRQEMRQFAVQTRVNERAHMFALWAGLPPIVYALYLSWYPFAIFLLAVAFVTNVYPIFLQRYTRARIARILAR